MHQNPIAAAIGIALLASQSVNALPNGKPFQELNALIESNATAIDVRSGPQKLDSALSEIFVGFQAANLRLA
jgi:hypothetical protein